MSKTYLHPRGTAEKLVIARIVLELGVTVGVLRRNRTTSLSQPSGEKIILMCFGEKGRTIKFLPEFY